MPVKSLIDLDVNDAAFNRFHANYRQYAALLAKQPAAFRQIQNMVTGNVKSFQELVALEVASIGKAKLMAEAHEKALRITKTESDHWREMARNTKTMATNIGNATLSLMKWGTLTSVFTGLLGAGGLFGIERLSQSAAAGRQQSLGSNVSFGDRRAFNTNFGRLVGPEFLNGINSSMLSAEGRASLYGAGVSDRTINTRDPAQVGLEALRGIKRLIDKTPDQLIANTLTARGISFLSPEQALALKNTSYGELNQLYGGFSRDRVSQNVSPDDLKRWQDFNTRLEAAGNTIESVFIRGLTPLTGPLQKLSEAATHVVERFLGNKGLEEVIKKVASGLEGFADYVSTPEFLKAIGTFVDGMVTIAQKIGGFIEWMGGGQGSEGYEDTKNRAKALREERETTGKSALSQLWDVFSPSVSGSEPGTPTALKGIVRKLEGSRDDETSYKGAVGRYQVTPDTARTYHFDPSRLKDPKYNEMVADAILADLTKRYNGNTDEILAAYNGGPGRANNLRRHGGDLRVLPWETQQYIRHAHNLAGYTPKVGVHVTIETPAGGSIPSNIRQIAPQ